MTTESKKSLLKIVGPGLLYAGAAIGVSHLVQSTSAGAKFGFGLAWAVVLANFLKYPFFQFAPRYTALTGKNLIQGYASIGKWAILLVAILTFATMFTIQGAVTVVTAGLAEEIFDVQFKEPWLWSAILMGLCGVILLIGKYSVLDKLMKLIIVTLAVTTIVALISGLSGDVVKNSVDALQFDWADGSHILLLIGLIGWMPAPLDVAIWHSMWSHEKQRVTGELPTIRETLIDFRIGYWGTAVLAFCFLALGAIMMYGSGEEIPASGGLFARKLIQIYTESIGSWAWLIIAVAAFTTMFSTTITCLDAFPRVLSQIVASLFPILKDDLKNKKQYIAWMLFTILGSLVLIGAYEKSMKSMVLLATVLSFFTAPLFAILNYIVITGKEIQKKDHPSLFTKVVSWIGILFLIGIGVYALTKFLPLLLDSISHSA